MNNRMLNSALKYAKFGWPIFPLAPKSKFPLKGSHGCKDATNDPDVIRAWWEKTPQANIGLACGIICWALDVDPRHGGNQSLEDLETKYGKLPDTIQQMSGRGDGGRHYVFHLPEGMEVRCGEIAPGLDAKGYGGYILLAPSIHPETGGEYTWDGAEPLEKQKILPAPEWLVNRVLKTSGASAGSRVSTPSVATMVALLTPAFPPEHKGRHDTFLALAGMCAHAKLPQSEAQELVDGIYTALWPSDPWLGEARNDVQGTYEKFRNGEKITGAPKLRQLGMDRTAVKHFGIWLKQRELETEDVKANRTAGMPQEERLASLNREPIFMEAQPILEFAEFRWMGQSIECVTTRGECATLECKELFRFKEAQVCFAEQLRSRILMPSTVRDKSHQWERIAGEMVNLANDRQWSQRNRIERDILAGVQDAFEYAGSPRVETMDERHKVHATLAGYRFNPLADAETPPCVYVWEGLLWVHTPILRRWLCTPNGGSYRWMLHEIENALVSCGFVYNPPMRSMRNGTSVKISLMSGPLGAIGYEDE